MNFKKLLLTRVIKRRTMQQKMIQVSSRLIDVYKKDDEYLKKDDECLEARNYI